MNARAHADFDIAPELAADFPPNVVKLKPVPPARPNADRLADLHRREGLSCSQRIADAKRMAKKDAAAFTLARKAAKATFEAEMLGISEAEAFARDRTAESIAEDERLLKYNRAAIEALAD